MFHCPVAHAASRSTAEPAWVNRAVVPPLWTMLTRKKSALVALLPWPRYHDRARFRVPPAGRVIAGERTEDVPPSRPLAPALPLSRRPVTRSLVPLVVVPSCFGPEESEASGSPRS